MNDSRVIVREPLTGPAVGRGPDLEPSDYVYELGEDEVAELIRVRDDLMARELGLGAIDPESVPLPVLQPAIADVVEDGLARV